MSNVCIICSKLYFADEILKNYGLTKREQEMNILYHNIFLPSKMYWVYWENYALNSKIYFNDNTYYSIAGILYLFYKMR